MTSITEHIQTNFKVLYVHPQSGEENWDTFLLAEMHNIPDVQAVNGEFIHKFGDEESRFLIESAPSLKEVKPIHYPNYLNQLYFQSTNHLEKRVLGWDVLDYGIQAMLNIRDFIYVVYIEKILLEHDPDHISFKSLFDFDFYKKVIGEELSQAFKQTISQWIEENRPFVNEILELETQVFALRRKTAEFRESIGEVKQKKGEEDYDRATYNNLLIPSMETNIQRIKIATSILELLNAKKPDIIKSIDEQVESNFPERTAAMVETLKKVREVVGSNGKVFLIAGLAHLQTIGTNPQRSLHSLYEFVATKKNIVVLAPKQMSHHPIQVGGIFYNFS